MALLRRVINLRSGLIALALAVAVGFATKSQWDWMLEDDEPQTFSAFAPGLDDIDSDSEQLYRITSENGSSVTYAVAERLAGANTTAKGTTTALAGDIAVNIDDPSASRMGNIVINVERFESDSSLRDKRIRHDYLESTRNPMAVFQADSVKGLPSSIDGEGSAEIEISGDLTIKGIKGPVTFSGTATVNDKELTATMSGTVKMSTYEIGPIHVAGLAHTDDEIEFTLDIVAPRTDLDEPAPTGEVQAVAAFADYPDGAFSKTVQPILENRCVSCHGDGGPGYPTIELDTAGQAAELADGIALVSRSGYMPPWPASELGLEMEHDFSLTDDELQTIVDWADAGGGIDVDPGTKLTATSEPYPPIPRDQVSPSRSAYVGDLAVKDDYRCQIHEIDDPEGDGEWVTGIAFEPDQVEIVHHSIIYRAPASARAEAEELNGADGRAGWTCFGLANMRSPGVQSIGGWAPGQRPLTLPEGVGVFLEPGSFIVNQIHYHFDHTNPPDQSSLVFDTLSSDEVANRDTPMTKTAGRSYLTPAEGPCTPEESGPLCERTAVLDDIAKKYGTLARYIPDGLIGICGGTVDDYDDLDGTQFSSSCDLPARDFGTLLSVNGHMHEFGEAYRMTLNPDTPEERILLDIPKWSFSWQLTYRPAEKIIIKPGDTFRFECTWDRANVTLDSPRYITWNEGTVDEMCFNSVSVIPSTNVYGEPNEWATNG